MIEVTFRGDEIADVIKQAQTFAAAFGPPAITIVAAPDKPARAPRTPKAETKAETKATETAPTETKAPDAAAELLAKQQVEAKDEALNIARELFATGSAGQTRVRAVAKEFGVKKLSEVPVEQALRLRELIGDAQQEHKAAEKTDAGDAI